MSATREQPLSSPDKVLNLSGAYRNYLSPLLLKGLTPKEYFQGGTKIVERVQTSYTPSGGFYLPTDPHVPVIQDTMTSLEIPWRFMEVNQAWNDHIIELNSGDRSTVYKNLKNSMRQTMFTQFWDILEAAMFARPNAAQMEGGTTTGSAPYSLRCFFTNAGGVPVTGTGVAQDDSVDTWTTLQTVPVSTTSAFQNQVSTYTVGDDDSLIDALDTVFQTTHFESPAPETGIPSTRDGKCRILTTREGYRWAKRIAGANNSQASPAGDIGWLMGTLSYRKIPIIAVDALESVYSTATKPGFWFANFDHFRLVIHKNRWMKAVPKDGDINQPFIHAEFRDTWCNIVCTARNRQGVVRAAA